MTLEFGKTYVSRNGLRRVTIEGETEGWTPKMGATYRLVGSDEKGNVTWRGKTGRFSAHPSEWDLVREVE